MRRNLALVLITVLVFAMALSGCSTNQGSNQGSQGSSGGQTTSPGASTGTDTPSASGGGSNNFVYAAGTEPTTFDPQFITDVNTARATMQIFETLVRWDENANIAPLLAESWTTSDDGLAWTFKLREGVTFHDGTPFNAEAAAYTFERILAEETGSPRRTAAEQISEIRVDSEYELTLITFEPFGAFLPQLTNYNLCILSPTAAKDLATFAEKPVGTGPLMLKEWQRGSYVTMTKYDGYWGEKSTVDELKFIFVPEDASRVMMLQTGEADIISGLPPIQVQTLEADPNCEPVIATGYRTIYVGINLRKPIFQDVKVRHAIQHAIDRQSIIDNVLSGIGKYPVGIESTVITMSAQDLPDYEYNPEKSKQLLAEAGYPDGFKTVLYSPEGRYPMDKQVAEVVQGMLKEVGIDAEIRILDWAAYQAATTAGEETELFLLGKGCPSGDPDYDLSLCLMTGGGMNNTGYSNPDVDTWMAEQQKTVDQSVRADRLYKAQAQAHADSPMAVLYYEEQTFGKRANVGGFIAWPNEMLDMRYLTRS